MVIALLFILSLKHIADSVERCFRTGIVKDGWLFSRKNVLKATRNVWFFLCKDCRKRSFGEGK